MNKNFKDETGHVYGRLRVLRRSTMKTPKHYGTLWLCLCDPELGGCGTEIVVRGTSLRNGLTRSCGCLRADKATESMTDYWQKKKGETH